MEPPFTGTFTYDAAGNLDGAHWTYDNKVNPLLTNKIWRFLARDYSVNNLLAADTYNDKGLPLHFSINGFGSTYSEFWKLYGDSINIQYDCQDGPNGRHY